MGLHISPGVLTVGGTATVEYSVAGQPSPVTVTIRGDGQLRSIQIHLDDDGQGTGTWGPVPPWDQATFSAPGCDEVVVAISGV